MAALSQMSSMAAPSLVCSPNYPTSHDTRRNSPSSMAQAARAATASATLGRVANHIIKKAGLFVPIVNECTISKATLLSTIANLLHGGRGNSKSGGGGQGGGGGGGEGGEDSNFWSRFFSLWGMDKDDRNYHGLPVDKLCDLENYKISDIRFFNRRRGSTTEVTEDYLFNFIDIRPGGTYTKAQLQEELETFADGRTLTEVDLHCKTKPDGTIGVRISFLEYTWEPAKRIRFINVGMMPQWNAPIEKDFRDMTQKEKMEYNNRTLADYSRRMERSRPSLLPMAVQGEISEMLRRENGEVSGTLLMKIQDRVQQWYYENGYNSAKVVYFAKLNTEEVVCEVVEGDI